MGRIVRPETDFGPILKRINDRLDKLERHNALDNASATINANWQAAGLPITDSTGLLVMKSGGFAAAPSTQSFSGAFADVTGSSFTLSVPQSMRIIYMLMATAQMTAGTSQGYIRGNIVGFDTTASIIWQNTAATIVKATGFMWYFTGEGGNFLTIPAGTYTVKLQGSADAGSTVQLTQYFHQVFLLGA